MSNNPSRQPTPDASAFSPDGNVPTIDPDASQSQLPDASAPIATTKGVQGDKNQPKPKRKRPSAFRKVRAKVQQLQMQRLQKAEQPPPQQDRKRVVYELRLPWWQKVWRWTGLGDKNGWDWAQLLAVPVMLAIVSWGLGEYAKSRDQLQQQADKEKEQALADDKAKQDTLVKYLDDMFKSIEGGLLDAAPGSKAFIVAQSRTVLALQSLDKKRQSLVIQFLRASGLNQVGKDKDTQKFLKKLSLLNLLNPPGKVKLGLLHRAQMEKANLTNSDLSGATLIEANLIGANLGCNPPGSKEPEHSSDWGGADLRGVLLAGANLRYTRLTSANLSGANLYGADLSNADLERAELNRALVSDATLAGANLSYVNLSGANLDDTNFSDAILLLTDVANAQSLTPQQLTGDKAPLLCNVRFPNYIKGIDPNRDCDRMPQELVNRYPKGFSDLQSAQRYVNELRQEKW